MQRVLSAVRLHGLPRPRFPRSTIARVGLGLGALGGGTISYAYYKIRQEIWSDDFKSDPPMPEYLDADYRDGMHSVSYDLLDEANGTLFDVLDVALANDEDPAVLGAIAQGYQLTCEVDDPSSFELFLRTLGKLTQQRYWETASIRERQRAMLLAMIVVTPPFDSVGDDDAAAPFVHWATAQCLETVHERRWIETSLYATILAQRWTDRQSELMPFFIGIASALDPLSPFARSDIGQTARISQPAQRALLSELYLALAFHYSDPSLADAGPATWLKAHRLHRRVIALLEGGLREQVTPEDLDAYAKAISRLLMHLGLHYLHVGDVGQAFKYFLVSREGVPEGHPVHRLSDAIIQKILITSAEEEEKVKETSKRT